ncbi:MAG: hypothetical protein A2V52_02680 [Actinobacteria bacterium RBG_19FT_COMBO_54_7]|uniref:Uncharacterized protein n=1 Tax=Candidatus Solincola sediminis TaxID=1797199 RepID=A0A1F2WHM6_9ACTN|nr:MAG: hypothetical protein A2Y75_03800 [Candidatus Solincola sediminis]OFW65593.1 MAG: hypothetical protein A2V52_02680 [Actinobacteria bacterium RBG_19FT_COMBO_54_7]
MKRGGIGTKKVEGNEEKGSKDIALTGRNDLSPMRNENIEKRLFLLSLRSVGTFTDRTRRGQGEKKESVYSP